EDAAGRVISGTGLAIAGAAIVRLAEQRPIEPAGASVPTVVATGPISPVESKHVEMAGVRRTAESGQPSGAQVSPALIDAVTGQEIDDPRTIGVVEAALLVIGEHEHRP